MPRPRKPKLANEEEAAKTKRTRQALVEDDDDDDQPEKETTLNVGSDEEDDDEDFAEALALDAFEDDGFLVDEVEEAEEEMDEEHPQKKGRKSTSLKSFVLDEDDYDLLQENSATAKFKRLKKGGECSKVGASSRFNEVNGSDDEGDTDEEKDEMADFIVDDELPDEKASPVRKRNQRERMLDQIFEIPLPKLATHDAHGYHNEILKPQKQSCRYEDGELVTRVVENYKYCEKHEIDKVEISEGISEVEEPNSTDFEKESSWILSQLANFLIPLYSHEIGEKGSDDGFQVCKHICQEDILRFLKLHHVERYDVPFICMYRKEECSSLLENPMQQEANQEDMDNSSGSPILKWHKVIWAIKKLDGKWLLLQKRKRILQEYYTKRLKDESHQFEDVILKQQLADSILKSLQTVESESDIDDINMKFNLYFPPVEVTVDEGLFRRPKTRSEYDSCSGAGLWKILRKFTCNPEQFALQVTLQKEKTSLPEPEEAPVDLASRFTCPNYASPEAVLRGARHMAMVEISCEPPLRKHVRELFLDNAFVSTRPTPEGNKAIDSYHQFAKVKWLHEKPVSKFFDTQWLLIQKAEEERLLEVSLTLPESTLNELKSRLSDCYLGDAVSESVKLWNEQRKLIIDGLFNNYLLPFMEKEALAILSTRAKNCLVLEYGRQLWNRVSVGPYQPKARNELVHEETAGKVMACCWGPGNPSTTFVVLGSSGEVLDVLHASYVSTRSQNVIDRQRQKNDWKCLYNLLRKHRPYVIVIGASNIHCAKLKEDIREVVNMVEETPDDIGQATNDISIIFGDESLPCIYEISQISSDQFPGKPGIVKRAAALGRYLQNPLAMAAILCGTSREILEWKLSPLQHLLAPDEKYEMIEQVMVDITNQVGVDVNWGISHDWLFAPLQFISGIGLLRADKLKRAFLGTRAIETRMDLAIFGLGAKHVFQNAVGFLCIRQGSLSLTANNSNMFDTTRIHPESYSLAEDLVKAVHKYYDQNYACDEDVGVSFAINYVRNNPEQFKNFDIIEYGDSYEKEKGQNKSKTLVDIRVEILNGFQDPRGAYKELSQDEEFFLLSAQKGDMLVEGRIIQATVRRVLPQKAICALDSGLTGMISNYDFSDKRDESDLSDKVHVGDTLSCKIKQVDKSKFLVYLTCKESELKRKQDEEITELDPYYLEGKICLPRLPEKTAKKEVILKKHFNLRPIVHSRFWNLTATEAIEFLSDKEPGESIFHPSPRGAFYLSLTLKVCDGVYAQKDIIEDGKDHKSMATLLHLGKSLKIGDVCFEDLDEVMEQYVGPLVSQLKAMLTHRKFKRGSRAEVDDMLRAEKSEHPMRIAYCLNVSYEHPGTFLLSYIRSTNPRHEYVGLYAEGFRFRKNTFGNIDLLLAYFQNHIDDSRQTPKDNNDGKDCTWGNDCGSQNSGFGGSGGRGRGRGGRGRGRGRGNAGDSDSWKGGFDDSNAGSGTWGDGSASLGERGRGRGRGRGERGRGCRGGRGDTGDDNCWQGGHNDENTGSNGKCDGGFGGQGEQGHGDCHGGSSEGAGWKRSFNNENASSDGGWGGGTFGGHGELGWDHGGQGNESGCGDAVGGYSWRGGFNDGNADNNGDSSSGYAGRGGRGQGRRGGRGRGRGGGDGDDDAKNVDCWRGDSNDVTAGNGGTWGDGDGNGRGGAGRGRGRGRGWQGHVNSYDDNGDNNGHTWSSSQGNTSSGGWGSGSAGGSSKAWGSDGNGTGEKKDLEGSCGWASGNDGAAASGWGNKSLNSSSGSKGTGWASGNSGGTSGWGKQSSDEGSKGADGNDGGTCGWGNKSSDKVSEGASGWAAANNGGSSGWGKQSSVEGSKGADGRTRGWGNKSTDKVLEGASGWRGDSNDVTAGNGGTWGDGNGNGRGGRGRGRGRGRGWQGHVNSYDDNGDNNGHTWSSSQGNTSSGGWGSGSAGGSSKAWGSDGNGTGEKKDLEGSCGWASGNDGAAASGWGNKSLNSSSGSKGTGWASGNSGGTSGWGKQSSDEGSKGADGNDGGTCGWGNKSSDKVSEGASGWAAANNGGSSGWGKQSSVEGSKGADGRTRGWGNKSTDKVLEGASGWRGDSNDVTAGNGGTWGDGNGNGRGGRGRGRGRGRGWQGHVNSYDDNGDNNGHTWSSSQGNTSSGGWGSGSAGGSSKAWGSDGNGTGEKKDLEGSCGWASGNDGAAASGWGNKSLNSSSGSKGTGWASGNSGGTSGWGKQSSDEGSKGADGNDGGTCGWGNKSTDKVSEGASGWAAGNNGRSSGWGK